jgi:26S proteasome regulatory subunit N8
MPSKTPALHPLPTQVDVSPEDVEIPTEAYCAVDEVRGDGTPPRQVFAHVASEIGALEAEEIGVEHLLRDVKDAEAPGSLAARLQARLAAVRGLTGRLAELRGYLERVAAGTLPLNQEVLTLLQEAMTLVGRTAAAGQSVTEAFAVRTNDMMLGVYIGSVVRAITALHDLINNKIALGEAERAGDDAVAARERAAADAAKDKDAQGKGKGKGKGEAEGEAEAKGK